MSQNNKITKNIKVKIPPSLSAEIGAMVEDFNSTVKFIAEQTSQIPVLKKRVDNLIENMELVKIDIDVIKANTKSTKESMGTVKVDINVIKNLLKRKVDIDEFAALERRVALLESRR